MKIPTRAHPIWNGDFKMKREAKPVRRSTKNMYKYISKIAWNLWNERETQKKTTTATTKSHTHHSYGTHSTV